MRSGRFVGGRALGNFVVSLTVFDMEHGEVCNSEVDKKNSSSVDSDHAKCANMHCHHHDDMLFLTNFAGLQIENGERYDEIAKSTTPHKSTAAHSTV